MDQSNIFDTIIAQIKQSIPDLNVDEIEKLISSKQQDEQPKNVFEEALKDLSQKDVNQSIISQPTTFGKEENDFTLIKNIEEIWKNNLSILQERIKNEDDQKKEERLLNQELSNIKKDKETFDYLKSILTLVSSVDPSKFHKNTPQCPICLGDKPNHKENCILKSFLKEKYNITINITSNYKNILQEKTNKILEDSKTIYMKEQENKYVFSVETNRLSSEVLNFLNELVNTPIDAIMVSCTFRDIDYFSIEDLVQYVLQPLKEENNKFDFSFGDQIGKITYHIDVLDFLKKPKILPKISDNQKDLVNIAKISDSNKIETKNEKVDNKIDFYSIIENKTNKDIINLINQLHNKIIQIDNEIKNMLL